MAGIVSPADESADTATPINGRSITTIRASPPDPITSIALLMCIALASGTPDVFVQLDSTDSTRADALSSKMP